MVQTFRTSDWTSLNPSSRVPAPRFGLGWCLWSLGCWVVLVVVAGNLDAAWVLVLVRGVKGWFYGICQGGVC